MAELETGEASWISSRGAFQGEMVVELDHFCFSVLAYSAMVASVCRKSRASF